MVNVPYSGHTNPTLPLAQELVRRGHDVWYVNAEEFRDRIEATGARFVPFINYPSSPTEQQKKTKCFRAAYDTALSLEHKFDLLIYEMFFYPGIKIAEKLNIPCVRQFSQPAWSKTGIADATRLFRLSSKLIDVQVMGKKNAKYMELEHKTLISAVLNDKPVLNIVYVPRLFQQDSASFGEDYLFTVPKSLNSPIARKIPYDKMKKPVLYISLGTIISSKGFYKKCIRAFGGKEVSVILNTGKVPPETLRKMPDNIYAYSYVPQLEVLRHADVFLTHCGMNSVNEAMSLGVPMVAMPFINDQLANAKRIVELNIGKRIRAFLSSGKRIYKSVCAVLYDKSISEQCERIRANLQVESSMEEIIDKIERITLSC